jgi:hypothetical protein
VVFGEAIGSAAIDYDFEQLVTQRLTLAHATNPFPIDPGDAAWDMMKTRDFQSIKCEFGAADDRPRICNGEMAFERRDLQKLFDKQIAKLFRLIDTQLQSLFQKQPDAQASHLVLNGGLGNNV